MSGYNQTRTLDLPAADAVWRMLGKHVGEYLTFGEQSLPFADVAHEAGWKGMHVQPQPGARMHLAEKMVLAYVAPDPRIMPLIDGTWVRSLTLSEIFVQFPGPYQLVAAVNTGQDRRILEHESIQACDPLVIVIGEDGHNEGVIDEHRRRGYACYLCQDVLVMTKRRLN